jgi:hypothetical protein
MRRINAFLVLTLAFSSICFGATLMQRSMSRSQNTKSRQLSYSPIDRSCEQLIKEYQQKFTAKIAEELYKDAFSLSFSGEWPAAEAASRCAAKLVNQSGNWAIEASRLIH